MQQHEEMVLLQCLAGWHHAGGAAQCKSGSLGAGGHLRLLLAVSVLLLARVALCQETSRR